MLSAGVAFPHNFGGFRVGWATFGTRKLRSNPREWRGSAESIVPVKSGPRRSEPVAKKAAAVALRPCRIRFGGRLRSASAARLRRTSWTPMTGSDGSELGVAQLGRGRGRGSGAGQPPGAAARRAWRRLGFFFGALFLAAFLAPPSWPISWRSSWPISSRISWQLLGLLRRLLGGLLRRLLRGFLLRRYRLLGLFGLLAFLALLRFSHRGPPVAAGRCPVERFE